MRRLLRSVLLTLFFSPGMQRLRRRMAELRRRVLRQPHVVRVFLELDDPYSYLLVHYLPALQQSYNIELRVYLAQSLGDGFKPAADMLAEYAVTDARRLASELGVPFLDRGNSPPVEHRRALLDSLAAADNTPDFREELFKALQQYWRGDNEGVARRVGSRGADGSSDRLLKRNSRLLEKSGHYNCATIHYQGEWYWGVDRLHYLTGRLDELGARKRDKVDPLLGSIRQVMHFDLPVTPPAAARDLPPLEYFHSFRSPYSYIGLRNAFRIADGFGLKLHIRPVLPLVMRATQVPRSKLMYVAMDAFREARRLDIPFGDFCDPLGEGTERLMAVFPYAQTEKRARDFVMSAGKAVMSEALDVASDKGLREVTGRSGLFWPDVIAALQQDDWRLAAEANRESMMEAGCWGVPTMRVGDFAVWGQDRDWMLVRHLEDLCDTGEGILV
jgi:2-hydroxychromene-2-carboxylate isomerase